MRRPTRGTCLPSVLLLALTLSACGSSSAASPTSTATATSASRTATSYPKMTVGLVTDVGGLHDKSFNRGANLGVKAAERQFGITGNVVESKTLADYLPNLRRFAQQHTGLTIAVGFSMQNAIYRVAREFPNDRFALVDAAPTDARNRVRNLSNVTNLFFKEQESGYLVGVIAGLMEKNKVGKATHGVIGYMGGVSIPAVDRYLAGYVAGAQQVDPGIKILGGYAQSFENPQVGLRIGLDQINRHADILFQVAGASGQGYLSAAQQRGVYGVGADSNQRYLGPYIIASALKRIKAAVKIAIREAQVGQFSGGDHRLGLAQKATGFAVSSTVVPPGIVAQARAYARKIAAGSIVPPVRISPH
jgi:basic membrane protein A and related proteins